MFWRITAFVTPFLFVMPLCASPTILSDNTADSSVGGDYVSSTQWIIEEFGTGSSSYMLDSVTLPLWSNPSGQFVDIYTNATGSYDTGYGDASGDHPGSLYAALDFTSYNTDDLSEFSLSGVLLNADSYYWVVVGSTSDSYYWDITENTSGSGVGWTGENGYTMNAGANWYYIADPGYYIPQMQVTGDPVTAASTPEPPTLLLFVSGLLGIPLLLRKGLAAKG